MVNHKVMALYFSNSLTAAMAGLPANVDISAVKLTLDGVKTDLYINVEMLMADVLGNCGASSGQADATIKGMMNKIFFDVDNVGIDDGGHVHGSVFKMLSHAKTILWIGMYI